jgi:hypothetical protein
MIQRDSADGVSQRLQIPLPAAGELRVKARTDPIQQFGDHSLQQVLPAGDIAVQRHCFDAERLAQASHRQPLRTVPVNVADSGACNRRPT